MNTEKFRDIPMVRRLQLLIIILLIYSWMVYSVNAPIYGILNGLYYGLIVASIISYKDNILKAINYRIIGGLILLLATIKADDTILNILAKIDISTIILMIGASYYISVGKEKRENNLRSIGNTSIVIMISLVIITTLGIVKSSSGMGTGTNEITTLSILFILIMPLLQSISIIIKTKYYYKLIILHSIMALYISQMQSLSIDQTYITVGTHILIIIATLTEMNIYRAKGKIIMREKRG